ncbi:MAG: hypothetical protein NVS4B8_21500 [Herpetosiphon sp.]
MCFTPRCILFYSSLDPREAILHAGKVIKAKAALDFLVLSHHTVVHRAASIQTLPRFVNRGFAIFRIDPVPFYLGDGVYLLTNG